MLDSSAKNQINLDPEKADGGGAGSQQAGTSYNDDCSAQTLIKQEILSQLHQITQRLNKLEDVSKLKKKTRDPTKNKNKSHKSCTSSPKGKKTKQPLAKEPQNLVIPNLVELGQNAQIQTQVQQRLKKLE